MNAKILVIDDEEAIRFTFERFLKTEGHVVATAESCSEAWTRINEMSFDLIFADIILDDGTGIDVLREIRGRGLSCPVIMITGNPSIETAAESIRLGAFDYIPKPINQEALLHATHTALKYKAVNEEKERYRTNIEAIFRSVQDAIITVDKESVVIELNEAAMTMCGYSRDDIGKSFSSLPRVCSGRLVEILEEAIKSGEPVEVDRIECHPDHRERKVISVRTYPLLSLQGTLSGVVMVLRDDTHVADLERELKEHRQFHRIVGRSEPMQKVYSLIRCFGRCSNDGSDHGRKWDRERTGSRGTASCRRTQP